MNRDFDIVLIIAFLAFIVLSLNNEKKSDNGYAKLNSNAYNSDIAEYSISDGLESAVGRNMSQSTRKVEVLGKSKSPANNFKYWDTVFIIH